MTMQENQSESTDNGTTVTVPASRSARRASIFLLIVIVAPSSVWVVLSIFHVDDVKDRIGALTLFIVMGILTLASALLTVDAWCRQVVLSSTMLAITWQLRSKAVSLAEVITVRWYIGNKVALATLHEKVRLDLAMLSSADQGRIVSLIREATQRAEHVGWTDYRRRYCPDLPA